MNMSAVKHCFHSPKLVMVINGIIYYCADVYGISDFDGDAVINFTGKHNLPQLGHIPQLAQHVDASYEELVIAWTDFGLPKVKPSFWRALHSYMKTKRWKKVCIHCEGGHGRTGTAMAAILISVVKWGMPEAVNFVRKKYCWKAVETFEQCEYLCNLDFELNNHIIDPRIIPVPSIALEAESRKKEEVNKNLINIIKPHIKV